MLKRENLLLISNLCIKSQESVNLLIEGGNNNLLYFLVEEFEKGDRNFFVEYCYIFYNLLSFNNA